MNKFCLSVFCVFPSVFLLSNDDYFCNDIFTETIFDNSVIYCIVIRYPFLKLCKVML